MDRLTNPFAPGAGIQPPELAGRDALIEEITIDMERVLQKRPTKGVMLLGLRGVGKTVLLNRLLEVAKDKGFYTAKVEAPEGGALPELLATELRKILYSLDLKSAASHKMRQAVSVLRNFARAFSVRLGEIEFGIEVDPGLASSGNLEQDLPDLLLAVAEAVSDRAAALGLFLDEVQYLSPRELAAIVVACHESAQRNLPFFFVGAGLPQIAALAGNAKSYAERLFNYPQVGPLTPEAAREALVKPAMNQGVAFEENAVEEILRLTKGYPYFVQEWGYHVWNTAPGSPISRAYVERATPQIITHFDANFFRMRFDRITGLPPK